MYSKEQKSIALEIFPQINSASETIRIWGYPTRRQLYTWIATENMVKRERKQLPRFANPPKHPRNPPLDVKLDAIRHRFEHGENIKYVSENIGYSRASIYQWRKRYLKKGTLGLMNNKNIPPGKIKEGTTATESNASSSHEVAELKNQVLEMQMEKDTLKETINVLKKTPASIRQL